MLFNSYTYFIFFPIVVLFYFMLSSVRARIIWLLIASYFFYMCWNPVFILLIIISTLIDYFVSKAIGNTAIPSTKKKLLWVSLVVNLGILFYFKYYNFLRENLQILFSQLNESLVIPEHSWLLPVGISFYTFQTLSYTIDVYRGHQKVETNFFNFALYVSFFPQLVAGPIERSTNLLPQFLEKHKFDYKRVRSGLLLILFGLFKKIVIADRFAIYADQVFDNPGTHSGMAVILGIIFFSFQIYCDFSGYTDIAIGSAKILGYRLMDNFKGPYFAKNIRAFWRHWHISLSTWFRDYVYVPLGGNRVGPTKLYRNLIIVFLVTGLWHGANWTFIVWGLFHGFFLIIERLGLINLLKKTPAFLQVSYTFIIVSLGWVFFRSSSMTDAILLLQSIPTADGTFFNMPVFKDIVQQVEFKITLILLPIIWLIHYIEFRTDFVESLLSKSIFIRWTVYILLILAIPLLGEYGTNKPFIYFQF